MKKSKIYLGIIIGILVIVLIWVIAGSRAEKETTLKVPVKSGSFQITVTTTGELEAKRSEKVLGPVGLRNFRIWEIKIEDIIPDGTVVDSGQYIASLDRSELVNKIKDKELELEKLETQYTKTLLDTTLSMRTARDNLINLKYALEEKQIVVDQSIYEPPATQRQARIELDKADRNYGQAVENYQVMLQQAIANMQEVSVSLRKARQEHQEMLTILNQFTIYAPKAGMVIYRRDYNGQKQGTGSSVSVWDPTVAELPNLKEMKSKTYVNEIDISKVKIGQNVKIGVDAFPDKQYTGLVTEVANIGQQLPNSNAKVFEVIIEVNEFDTILRPAMTSKNEIITSTLDNVLYLPLECVQSNDSISYVYEGSTKKQVMVGPSNDNEIVIEAGLSEGDEVYLLPPKNAEDFRLVPLDKEIIEKYRLLEMQKKARNDSMQMQHKSFDMMKEMKREDFEKMRKDGQSPNRRGPRPGTK